MGAAGRCSGRAGEPAVVKEYLRFDAGHQVLGSSRRRDRRISGPELDPSPTKFAHEDAVIAVWSPMPRLDMKVCGVMRQLLIKIAISKKEQNIATINVEAADEN